MTQCFHERDHSPTSFPPPKDTSPTLQWRWAGRVPWNTDGKEKTFGTLLETPSSCSFCQRNFINGVKSSLILLLFLSSYITCRDNKVLCLETKYSITQHCISVSFRSSAASHNHTCSVLVQFGTQVACSSGGGERLRAFGPLGLVDNEKGQLTRGTEHGCLPATCRSDHFTTPRLVLFEHVR